MENIDEHEVEHLEHLIGVPAWFDTLGKFLLSDEQVKEVQNKEMAVHGIPVAILARVNLFLNDRSF